MTLIFKYVSESVIGHVFNRDGHVGIKCSLPQDYNDPYELFLGIDLEQGSELLATYSEVVGEVPSQLTTCFSKSPVVAPMWAHYADNHRGCVIGFDVTALQDVFPDLLVRDIAYREGPHEGLVRFTQMAAHRKKPRDAMALQHAVTYESYFSKYLEWSYEQEVRAVNFEAYVEDIGGHKVLFVPAPCVAVVIAGAKSTDTTKASLREAATELDAHFYGETIGRSFPTPYLVDEADQARIFADGGIAVPAGTCAECGEPLRAAGKLCPWCAIDDADRLNAAGNNPFRILDGHGLLEDYFKNFPRRPRVPYK